MRLKSFSVQKYRSIVQTERIAIGGSTVLVGPNNEGKSNILRALILGMRILTRGRVATMRGRTTIMRYRVADYNWERDYPIHLQEKKASGKTVLILEFEPTDIELEEFQTEIKSRLKGTIPLRIEIGNNDVSVAVHKKGPGSAALSKKSNRIAEFITRRIDFEHIEAVRTAANAERAVSEMVARELAQLEEDDEYNAAVQRISELQQPLLDQLSESIRDTLRKFLHKVKSVSISIPSDVRYRTIRHGCEVIIDDGFPTPLEFKGDGAQSLAALGILRHATEKFSSHKNLLVAIEEPESHLHPAAIHELKAVLDALGEKHQLILTTHNPLFVDRRCIADNIIVRNRKARSAKSIEEIRDILGVKASDNLRNAELVLVVEGEDDRLALLALLPVLSSYLSGSLANSTLAIDTLAGGSNLSYKVTLIRNALCMCNAFLDSDKAGIQAFKRAQREGVLDGREVNFAVCPGLKEAELEDLYRQDLYLDPIYNKYGVSLAKRQFKTKKKWSDRVKDCFIASGKFWDEQVELEIKIFVAELVASSPEKALNDHVTSLQGLVDALEVRLKNKESAQQKDALDYE
jgi:putative ATP-dependent endonuclease of the OLD family